MTSNSQAHRRSLSVPGRKLSALQASAKSSTSDRRIQVIEGRRWVPIRKAHSKELAWATHAVVALLKTRTELS